ncbi:beta-galactosidase trimerization domain-containing protein [Paenibacillus sp. TAB 01]|uniref:beta-galactosidase trimerization domain-containing protein n=1 Tax=Paenibacillus sp. TAB 01 TaxID=3368988 RepID=UPI00375063A3
MLHRQGQNELYAQALWGAYQAFFDQNVQADWVHIDDIEQYRVIYLPYPIMLTPGQAESLRSWVDRGGTLISEGCPGYFGARGRVGTRQPNHGLDAVFGALETDVEFTPDLDEGFEFSYNGSRVLGGGYRQAYRTAGGQEAGSYEDGTTAVVKHVYGQGRTLLIGTFPSVGYYRTRDEGTRAYFAGVLEWAGIGPHIRLTDTSLQARLSRTQDGQLFLWVINPIRQEKTAELKLAGAFSSLKPGRVLWGETVPELAEASRLRVSLPARDVLVLELTPV